MEHTIHWNQQRFISLSLQLILQPVKKKYNSKYNSMMELIIIKGIIIGIECRF